MGFCCLFVDFGFVLCFFFPTTPASLSGNAFDVRSAFLS